MTVAMPTSCISVGSVRRSTAAADCSPRRRQAEASAILVRGPEGQGLASAGASVRGYDPFIEYSADGIEQFRDLGAAFRGTEFLIRCAGAPAVREVAREVLAPAHRDAPWHGCCAPDPDGMRTVYRLATHTIRRSHPITHRVIGRIVIPRFN